MNFSYPDNLNAPIDLEVFENAVHKWFANATGLTVIWQTMAAPQPCYPYGSLQITSGPTPAAPQWEQRTYTELSNMAGEEVATEVVIPCSFVVSCQAYVGQPEARCPHKKALYYLTVAQSSLSLPSVLAEFRSKQISVIRPDTVQNIDELIEDAYVSRASMDVTFGASLNLVEYTTYIQTVHAVSQTLGIDQTFGDT